MEIRRKVNVGLSVTTGDSTHVIMSIRIER